jgi:hypothetical protein
MQDAINGQRIAEPHPKIAPTYRPQHQPTICEGLAVEAQQPVGPAAPEPSHG